MFLVGNFYHHVLYVFYNCQGSVFNDFVPHQWLRERAFNSHGEVIRVGQFLYSTEPTLQLQLGS